MKMVCGIRLFSLGWGEEGWSMCTGVGCVVSCVQSRRERCQV